MDCILEAYIPFRRLHLIRRTFGLYCFISLYTLTLSSRSSLMYHMLQPLFSTKSQIAQILISSHNILKFKTKKYEIEN